MPADETTQKFKQLFEDFFKDIDQLKAEHQGKIQAILDEIQEMKLDEIRAKLNEL